jgi:hypothetical protein
MLKNEALFVQSLNDYFLYFLKIYQIIHDTLNIAVT